MKQTFKSALLSAVLLAAGICTVTADDDIKRKTYENPAKAAKFFADKIIPVMREMRANADEMEQNTAKKYWPFPTYGDILFSV